MAAPPLSVKVDMRGVLMKDPPKALKIYEREMGAAMRAGVSKLEHDVKAGTPVGATAILRGDIQSDVRGRGLNLHGIVFVGGAGAIYAEPVEMGCYDATTEILSRRGWVKFPELDRGEEVLTLNPSSKQIEWQNIGQIFAYDYHGSLISYNHGNLDLLTTPNHQFFIHDRRGRDRFCKAQDLPSRFRTFRAGKWKGKETESITIPSYTEKHGLGKHGGYFELQKRQPINIKAEDWMEFFGLWLAEGCVDSHRVTIAQSAKRKAVGRILAKLPFKVSKDKRKLNFRISNVQLATYLKPYSRPCYEKFIPSEYKDLSRPLLKKLLRGMMLGDGNVFRNPSGNPNHRYYTTSRRLADDLQEVLAKLGLVGIISSRRRPILDINGHKTYSRKLSYTVRIRKRSLSYLDNRNREEKIYNGKVFSCSVPNQTLYVRRNDKPVFCGNSTPHWPPPGPIELWVKRVLGISDAEEVRRTAYVISRKISRTGTAAHHMFRNAFQANKEKIVRLLEDARDRVISQLKRG